jgi:hypothetical protein
MIAAKFKPLIFSVWGLALSNVANIFIFIFMILDDFCLLPAWLCYVIINVRNLESHMNIADRCAPRKGANGAENLILQALPTMSVLSLGHWDRPNSIYSLFTLLRPWLLVSEWVNLRPTVSRPVCPDVRRPSGTCDQFYFLLEISFRHLRFCKFVAPSLTRGRVCKLLYNCFWALPEQSLLGRSPVELTALFYCLIWDSTNLKGQVPLFRSHVSAVRNFNITIGRAAWEACSATWNLGTNWAFALGPRKTTMITMVT